MKKEFSFSYGEKRCVFSAENNAVYELEKGVTVQVVCKEYKEYDAVEWVLWFENKGKHDSQIFSEICDCDSLLPLEIPDAPKSGYQPQLGNVCVISMKGMVDWEYYERNDKVSATEYSFDYEYLDKIPGCKKSFCNVGGRSSNGTMPFFDITANGDGYIAAIGWSGDWKAEFSKSNQGVRMNSGLKETHFYLKPGEKIRTTSVLIMKYNHNEEKHNKFRHLIKDYFSHKSNTNAARDGLMAFELWGTQTSEEMKKRIRELAQYDIKFEEIWIDAGWYGNCTKFENPVESDWFAQTGDWTVNTRIHPGSLKDVAKCAQDAGMKLMLWFEPERAIQGTKILEQHPEWFLSLPNDTSKILNYGNQDAWNYMKDLLSYYINELQMSCYRQDFNVDLTAYFKRYNEENRRGITEIKHIMGMYGLWDILLEKYPHLIIDNCSSGGRRIDIETLKRSIPFFRTDYQCFFNANPEVLQVHNSNSSAYFPYIGCTSKIKSDTYAIRSSYSSSWGGAFYNAIFQSMNEEDFKWAKKITDEYRRIRKYFSKDFYNHGSSVFDDTAWTIWQYNDPETQSGIIMAFRRCESPFEQVTIELKGVDKNETYIYKNIDSEISTESTNFLTIALPKKRSSLIVEYRQKNK